MWRLVTVLLLLASPVWAQTVGPQPITGADISAALSTATGSTTARTGAARAADIVNVKNFGAKGDLVSANTSFTIAAGSNALSSAIGVFGTVYVGKTVIVGGAGAAGGPLITTIAGFTDASHVTLAANASTSLSAVALRLPIGTDDSVAINAAVTAVKNAAAQVPSFSAAGVLSKLYFPKGMYLVLSSINMTGSTNPNFQISGDGATVYGATNGFPVFDGLGSRFIRWSGLDIAGDQYAPPNTGIQIGRTDTTNNNSSDNHAFTNVTIRGYFSLAGFYNLNAEQTHYSNLQVYNSFAATDTYAAIFDGINHFGLTSQFVTENQPANAQQSFNSNSCMDCIFYGAGQAPVWVAGASELKFISSYMVNTSPTGPYYGVVIYTAPITTSRQLDFDVHFETTTTNFTNSFFFTGTNTTPAIPGFHWRDMGAFSSSSFFKADAGITAVNISGLDLDIASYLHSGSPPAFLDQPAIYTISGNAAIPSTSTWNPANFTGVWCEQSGGCHSSLPLPATLNASALQSTGGITGVTLGGVAGSAYYVQGTGPGYTPTVSFAAPGGTGTTASATISQFALNGFASLVPGSGGSGYTNGDVCTMKDALGVSLYTMTIASLGASNAIATNTNSAPIAQAAIPTYPLTPTCPGGGTGAIFQQANYRPSVYSFLSNGSGYSTPPAATFSTFGIAGSYVGSTGIVSAALAITSASGSVVLNGVGTQLGLAGAGGFPVINLGAIVDGSGVRVTLGATYTVPVNTSLVRFIQGTTLAASTVTLPTVHTDGQPIQFVNYAGAITALTFSPAVNGWTAGSTLAANTGLRVRWDATSAAWFREQ